MDKPPDAKPLLLYVWELAKQKDQESRAQIFFNRLRQTKWGEKNLASTEAVDRLDLRDEEKTGLKQMLAETP